MILEPTLYIKLWIKNNQIGRGGQLFLSRGPHWQQVLSKRATMSNISKAKSLVLKSEKKSF